MNIIKAELIESLSHTMGGYVRGSIYFDSYVFYRYLDAQAIMVVEVKIQLKNIKMKYGVFHANIQARKFMLGSHSIDYVMYKNIKCKNVTTKRSGTTITISWH